MMTIDQIIAMTASIAACISAFATFRTVREMAKQREASYRPELVFSGEYFETIESSLIFQRRWVRTQAQKVDAPFNDSPVHLQNIGLGVAKSVVIHWSFPIEQMIERANKLAQRTMTPAYFEILEKGFKVNSKIMGEGLCMWENQMTESLGFVLPVSIQKEPQMISVPQAYVTLCSAIIQLELQLGSNEISLELPPLLASLEYFDIGERQHRALFRLKFDIAIASSTDGFKGLVKCTKTAQRDEPSNACERRQRS